MEERRRPFCCRQSYADLFFSLAKKEDTWHVWVYAHAEDTGGLECPLSLSTLVPWDRVYLWTWSSLSSHLGWQATKGQPNCPVLEAHCGQTLLLSMQAGSRAQVPRLMHACSSLPMLLSAFISPFESYFFLIWTCLQQVYFQSVSISLHLDGVALSFSQVLYFVWKELDFKVGQKDGSLTATYSLILSGSYCWAEPVAQFYSMCLAWTMDGGEKVNAGRPDRLFLIGECYSWNNHPLAYLSMAF